MDTQPFGCYVNLIPGKCLVAYICAARNRVERMWEVMEKIARALGECKALDGDKRYTFPTPGQLRDAEKRLADLKLGLGRASRIVAAASAVCEDKLNLRELAQPQASYEAAMWRLRALDGVGYKTANCVALFALDKPEAFPVDVNIRRAIRKRWPELSKGDGEGLVLDDETLVFWARDRFGRDAGYAGQLLFQSERRS